MQIKDIPLNPRIHSVLKKHNITFLYPPQEKALRSGVLEGKNLVLAAPTSAGKTLVAEICILKAISEGRGRTLYIVPLKSLAREKYFEFKKYESLGVTIALSVGDFDSPANNIADADVAILTTERADSLVRHSPKWLSDVGVIIFDEIHVVNDPTRGPTLEMLIAKIRHILPTCQIIALSATISNAQEIANWLDSELVECDWRSVPLNEGILLKNMIYFANNKTKLVKRYYSDDATNLVLDTIKDGGQVLVFVASRKSTVALAKKLATPVATILTEKELKQLRSIAQQIASRLSAPELTLILSRLTENGVAFHHAGLTNRERAIIEDCFRKNLLKVVVATPTLAAGVNLPARRVIIRDYKRYEQGRGSVPIPILEYKQMAGRAGRPDFDKYGEAILIARTDSEYRLLSEHYVTGTPERIESKLAEQSVLRFHLLAAVASEMAHNFTELNQLLDKSFFAYQYPLGSIRQDVKSAIHFLQEGGLIHIDKQDNLTVTQFGQRVSRLYISPETAILFNHVLSIEEDITSLGYLHLICHSPDQPLPFVSQNEIEEYELFIEDNFDDFAISPQERFTHPKDYLQFLSEVKCARILLDWIEEFPERDITDIYNVGMGDVHRLVQSAEWLAYSASEISRVINKQHHIHPLYNLRLRLKYGVKLELLELVSLKGIGRVRGRMLFNYGLRTIKDLYDSTLEEIARVPSIGQNIAEQIKQQLGQSTFTDATTPPTPDSSESIYIDQTFLDDF